MAGKRDAHFRPDPSRGIYVIGELNDDLLGKVIPQIVALRQTQEAPITVYISSPGGSMRTLDVLSGALQCGDMDGEYCDTITVAIGDAASAAAILLTLGGYAVAFPQSGIHFHGARMDELRHVTMEDAAEWSALLATRNRESATKVANCVIRRLVHRFTLCADEITDVREADHSTSLLEAFAGCIKKHLSTSASSVLDRTMERTRSAVTLADEVFPKISFGESETLLQQDTKVFEAVLRYEVSKERPSEWRLDEEGISTITSDYLLVREYQIGDHNKALRWILATFGELFLESLQEHQEYEKVKAESAKAARTWLLKNVRPRIRPFWYFTVCLSKQLQEGENQLTSTDAYWLGVVDEVVDTDLKGFRAFAEAQTEDLAPKDKDEAPTAAA